VVGEKPPQVTQQVRTAQFRDAMPHDSAQVDVLYARAVEVKLIIVGKAGDEFSYTALCAVALIDEGRNHCDTPAGHDTRR
jgi:hypothetical protein